MNAADMLIDAAYARVSTLEQARNGYSLPDQLSACHEKLTAEGYHNIVDYIDEGCSGEFLDRPALDRLRDDVVSGRIDVIAVLDPDRLSRDLTNQLILAAEFEKANVKLMFVTGDYDASPEGKLFFSMKGAISEFEKAKIRERSMRGKREKARQGKIIQDFGLYGYDYDTNSKVYTINETEAHTIREIYRLSVENHMSVQDIQKRLKQDIVFSPTGKPFWPVSSIHNVLTNKTYTGTFYSMKFREKRVGLKQRVKTERSETDWIGIPIPSIIDQETFELAQEQLKRNRVITKKPMAHPYLLSGILYCGVCGRKMVAHHCAFQNGKRVPYYQCCTQRYPNMRIAGLNCKARSLPANEVDRDIWDKLTEVIADPDLALQYYPKHNKKEVDTEGNLERLAAIEADLVRERETIAKWFREKMLSEEHAERQLKDIRTRLTDIESRKKELAANLVPAPKGMHKISEQLKPMLQKDSLTDDEKRSLIRKALKKITVIRTDTTKGTASVPVFQVTWETL